MTLKKCSCCKKVQTTKNTIFKGRDEYGIYLNCKSCGSTLLLRAKNWKAQFQKTVAGLVFLFLISGCSTLQSKLIDTQNRPNSQHVLDDRACTRYYYQGHSRMLDEEYYYACMADRGYRLVQSYE